MKTGLYSLLAFLLLAACSTAPRQQEDVVETKNQAAEFIDFGNKAFESAQYDQALKFFNLALDENITVDNEPGIANAYNSIGKVYLRQREITRAREFYEAAMKIAVKIEDSLLISQSSNNIGETFLIENDTATALDYFNEALNLSGTSSEQAQIHLAVINNNIGIVYKRLGRYEDALSYLEKSMKINSKYKKFAELATNYYMISSVYSKQSQFDAALGNIGLALEMDKKVENSPNIAQDLYVTGLILNKKGDRSQAFDYFEKSYMIYERLNLPSDMEKVLVPILEYLQEQGDAKRYNEYKRIQNILKNR
jgi:tetratricopeptide (TPR) repeat protein